MLLGVLAFAVTNYNHFSLRASDPLVIYSLEIRTPTNRRPSRLTADLQQIAYPIDIALIKFSFLAFTWRVFHVKPMKLPVIVTTTLVVVWFIAIVSSGKNCVQNCQTLTWNYTKVLIAIFPCRPIHGFWDLGIGAKCINYLQFYLAQSVYSIITDLMILILPMPFVWRLRISWGQKLGITCIFCVGILYVLTSSFFYRCGLRALSLVIVSIIRMTLQVKYMKSSDFTCKIGSSPIPRLY